jgi:hypothetical protein
MQTSKNEMLKLWTPGQQRTGTLISPSPGMDIAMFGELLSDCLEAGRCCGKIHS